MAKIWTLDELIDAVTSDFTWRVKEISDFKSCATSAKTQVRAALLRGGVPLIYAHWEGHVAYVARKYAEFVLAKRLRHSDLSSAFMLHPLSRRFDQIYGKRLTLAEKVDFIVQIDQCKQDRFGAIDGQVIRTRSNLNSIMLRELCNAINVDVAGFEQDFDFIDKLLVGRRNHIAHGQDIQIELTDFNTLVDRTIRLMRQFRSLVENEAVEEGFRS